MPPILRTVHQSILRMGGARYIGDSLDDSPLVPHFFEGTPFSCVRVGVQKSLLMHMVDRDDRPLIVEVRATKTLSPDDLSQLTARPHHYLLHPAGGPAVPFTSQSLVAVFADHGGIAGDQIRCAMPLSYYFPENQLPAASLLIDQLNCLHVAVIELI